MQITCLGAARTVTGSCYLVEMGPEQAFLVDCGLFQGGRQIERRNRLTPPFRPKQLKAILITHAHIDHSGLVPRMVRQGYRGPIFASRATCELLEILWLDSAHIQEMEAEWANKRNRRQGKRGEEPLYETEDARRATELLRPVDMEDEVEPLPGVSARFVTAGHILGAASLLLTLRKAKAGHRLGFSGDLGRPGQLIIPDAQRMPLPDTLFMEATYGSRRHKALDESQRELVEVIQEAYKDGGKVLIPAFAVERTQELIYTLARAFRAGELPADLPVFLDSPLAIAATEVFRRHPEFFNHRTQEAAEQGPDPLDFANLRFTSSTEQSQAINSVEGPAVIIAGNGMASAGRIKHHLKHNLWKTNTHVVIVGFQAQGTPGRALVEGAAKLRIMHEEVAVRAKVHTIGGFSAHADQEELLTWLGGLAHPGLTVNLTHAEESAAEAFLQIAQARYPQVRFHIPQYKEVLTLESLPASDATAGPKASALAQRARAAVERLHGLADRLSEGAEDLAPERLARLEQAIAAIENLPQPDQD
jgi:metallo-beta-lactamase family protein